MKLKDHKDNPITWQAHAVTGVLKETLITGKFPNGKIMSQKDITEANDGIANFV